MSFTPIAHMLTLLSDRCDKTIGFILNVFTPKITLLKHADCGILEILQLNMTISEAILWIKTI